MPISEASGGNQRYHGQWVKHSGISPNSDKSVLGKDNSIVLQKYSIIPYGFPTLTHLQPFNAKKISKTQYQVPSGAHNSI